MMLKQSKRASTREKFVNELLADPKVQERWVELWKERLTKENQKAELEDWIMTSSDPLGRLLGEMLRAKRSDEQILDALCLATMARLPTKTERRVILGGANCQSDRWAAWDGVVGVLPSTSEAKAHAAALTKRSEK